MNLKELSEKVKEDMLNGKLPMQSIRKTHPHITFRQIQKEIGTEEFQKLILESFPQRLSNRIDNIIENKNLDRKTCENIIVSLNNCADKLLKFLDDLDLEESSSI